MALFRLLAVLALLGFSTTSVMADGVCVPTCADEIQNTHFKELGCSAANEVGCLCVSQGFVDLVAECSVKNCAANVDEIRQGLVGSDPPRFCVAQADKLPAARVSASPSSPSSPPASTSPPAASTPPPSSSSIVSPSPASTSPATPSSLSASTTSTTSATPNTSAAPVTPATSSTSSSGTTTSGHSSTSTSAASETSPASSPVPASGITSGAAAGIGIGVAIVVVAVAVIAFCLLRNRKKQAAPRHSIEISKPLPGSGPTYPTRDDRERDRDSYDKYGHDIEMTSHRYEDMIPSQQPRNMV